MNMTWAMFYMLCAMFLISARAEQNFCTRAEREENAERLEPIWSSAPLINCDNQTLDAVTTTKDLKTYFFKGYYYWQLLGAKVAPGYPRLIEQDWNGLPAHLDAALTWTDGRTFFFKGKQYWSFHNKTMDEGYPRLISEGFCGIPDNIDGAVTWKPNGKAYFFKGNKFWRFDGGDSCTPVLAAYPSSMSEWKGIPSNVDDALQWDDGRTYFMKNGYYYRYNDDGNDSGAGQPVLLHGNWGLKCEELRCRIPLPAPLSTTSPTDDPLENLV